MAEEFASSRNESPPLTFSLRTMFSIVTCAATIFAAIGAIKTERPQIIFGILFAMTLLSIIAFIVGRRRAGEWLIALSFALLLLGLYAIAGVRRFVNYPDAASKNNLRQIGQALTLYATIHQGLPTASVVFSDSPSSDRTRRLVKRPLHPRERGVRVAGNDGSQFFVGALFLSFFLAIWSSARRSFPVPPGIFFLLSILFVVLSLPNYVIKGHSTARRVQCDNNLRQIGEALKSYHQKYGSFPPAYVADANGKPLYSWRAVVLMEMGRTDVSQRLKPNEPWNGPKNSLLAAEGSSTYICTSVRQPVQMTSYLAVVGPRSAWPVPQVRKLADFKNPAKTIIVLEMPNSGVNWLEPRDLFVGQLKDGLGAMIPPGSLPPHSDGFEALFADGHVETLPANIDPKILAEMLEVDPGGDSDK